MQINTKLVLMKPTPLLLMSMLSVCDSLKG